MPKINSENKGTFSTAIIPYASKTTSLEIQNGHPTVGQFLCFGVRGYASLYFSDNLDILDYTEMPNYGGTPIAFVMPREGTLLSIASYFYFMSNNKIDSEAQIVTRLYQADSEREIYKAIPNTITYLEPKINEDTSAITLYGKLTDLNIVLKTESRIIMVIYMISNDPNASMYVSGYAGGSLDIK